MKLNKAHSHLARLRPSTAVDGRRRARCEWAFRPSGAMRFRTRGHDYELKTAMYMISTNETLLFVLSAVLDKFKALCSARR